MRAVVRDNRRFVVTVAVFFACGLAVAALAGLAWQRAQRAVIDSQVEACESRNKQREDTRALFAYLVQLSTRNRGGDLDGAARAETAALFFDYLDEAYDPVPCEWGHPSFGVDPDPPTTIPAGGR